MKQFTYQQILEGIKESNQPSWRIPPTNAILSLPRISHKNIKQIYVPGYQTDIIKKWIQTLKETDLPQCKEFLYRYEPAAECTEDGAVDNIGYCCLGILATILTGEREERIYDCLPGDIFFLSDEIITDIGQIILGLPYFYYIDYQDKGESHYDNCNTSLTYRNLLTSANDNGIPFHTIAQAIENHCTPD